MTNQIEGIELSSLEGVVGGAGVDKAQWQQVLTKAKDICPNTVQKYSAVDPSTLNRSKAQKMGNECLAEMPSWKRSFAQGPINDAINQAFPGH